MGHEKATVAVVISAIGAGLTAVSAIVGPDSTAGQIITVAIAVLTALTVGLGVYSTPNTKDSE